MQTAYTLYTLRVTTSVNSGVGKAGVAFFAANKTILSAPAIDLPAGNSSVHTMRVSAPQGSMAASVFVGKFDGMGGQLQARDASQLGPPSPQDAFHRGRAERRNTSSKVCMDRLNR